MICRKCNNQNSDTAKFCKICGEKLMMSQEPEQGFEIQNTPQGQSPNQNAYQYQNNHPREPIYAQNQENHPQKHESYPQYQKSYPQNQESYPQYQKNYPQNQENYPQNPVNAQAHPQASPVKSSNKNLTIIIVLCVLVVLAFAGVGLVYKDNYKKVFKIIGNKTEVTESETEADIITTEEETSTLVYTPEPQTSEENPINEGYSYIVSTNKDDLRMRSGPGENYSVVGLIPKNTIVKVTKIHNHWGLIEYKGVNGWCSMDFLRYLD